MKLEKLVKKNQKSPSYTKLNFIQCNFTVIRVIQYNQMIYYKLKQIHIIFIHMDRKRIKNFILQKLITIREFQFCLKMFIITVNIVLNRLQEFQLPNKLDSIHQIQKKKHLNTFLMADSCLNFFINNIKKKFIIIGLKIKQLLKKIQIIIRLN